MTSLRYYRHYLWVYAYMYISLFLVAMIWDFVSPANTANSELFMARFFSVLVPFIFSVCGILVQYHVASFIFDFDLLKSSKKTWISSFLRFSKRKNKKMPKKINVTKFMLSNMFSNFIPIIPVIVLGIVCGLGLLNSSSSTILSDTNKALFLVSFFIKHAAWYFVFFFSRIYIFWGKKRIRNLS